MVTPTSEKRYTSLVDIDNTTTAVNTDIITDTTITEDGILRIGVVITDASADFRITLNQTHFTTLGDPAADIWTFFEVPCAKGDILNFQTVGAESIDLRVILDTGGFYTSIQA